MNVMRRLKSIASGRSSVSDPVGDSSIKRVKVDQEVDRKVTVESQSFERCAAEVEQNKASTSRETAASSSHASSIGRAEKSGYDELPKEMHEMKIRDENHDDKDMEGTFVHGNGPETGQIISTTVSGRNGQPKQTISYMAERVVGTGSFGVVFQAKCLETGEAVAIKKVLQDKRYKNRELQIMRSLDHPNVVQIKHHPVNPTPSRLTSFSLSLGFSLSLR